MATPAVVSTANDDRGSFLSAATRLWESYRTRIVGLAWIVAVAGTLALVALAVPARYAFLLRTTQNLTPAQSLVLADVLAVFGANVENHIRVVVGIEVLMSCASATASG